MWRIEFNPDDLIRIEKLLRADYPELFGGEILTGWAIDVPEGRVRVTHPNGEVGIFIYQFEMDRRRSLVFWQGDRCAFKIKSKAMERPR